jgi:hypothetical protein
MVVYEDVVLGLQMELCHFYTYTSKYGPTSARPVSHMYTSSF